MKLSKIFLKPNLTMFWAILAVLTAACQANPSPAPTQGATAAAIQSSAYPGSAATATLAPSYPGPGTGTPGNSVSAMVIDRPVKAGATTITGHALAGVVVGIDNVTIMGDELGSGVVGPDGRFSVTVPPLEANVRIGLWVKDTGSSGKTIDDFNGAQFMGPGAMMVPQVGYFVDTVSVQP